MPFCSNCGTKMSEQDRFCAVCGRLAGAGAAERPAPPVRYSLPAPEPYEEDFNISKEKVFAILAYIGPLVLIPIVSARELRFVRFHANQGLILFIYLAAGSVLLSVLSTVLIAFSRMLTFISVALSSAGWIAALALIIIGIVNAASGRQKPLPVIGGITLLK